MKRVANRAGISTLFALCLLTFVAQGSVAKADLLGGLKKGVNKLKKGAEKAVGKIKKGVEKTAGKIEKGVEKVADDVADAAESALRELNPKLRLSGGARLSRGSLILLVNADVQIAGQRLNVQLFNAAVKKSRNAIQVSRKVGKHMSVTLKILFSGDTIKVDPSVKVKVGKRRIKLPVPSLTIRA
jgi:hypothetical protein